MVSDKLWAKTRSSFVSHVGRIALEFVSSYVEVINFEHLHDKSPSRAALNLDNQVEEIRDVGFDGEVRDLYAALQYACGKATHAASSFGGPYPTLGRCPVLEGCSTGFSKGLGYPLTNQLLTDVWDRLPSQSKDQLIKIVQFHHPRFDVNKSESYPDVEQLLTEISVNLRLFDASRPSEGRFTKSQLRESRRILLHAITLWFHELYENAAKTHWLSEIVQRMRRQNAAIVSFNWDLILDHRLFSGDLNAEAYGLAKKLGRGPLLLKPHGSLNWYVGSQLEPVSEATRIQIFHSKDRKIASTPFFFPATWNLKWENSIRR
jgi:hypothetical protein